jgi:hypothetical protein
MDMDRTVSADSQKALFGFVNAVDADADGRFRFTEVPPGRYGLVGFPTGGQIEIVDGLGRPLVIRVGPGGPAVDLGTILVRP